MPKRCEELSAFQVRRIRKPGEHRVGGVAGLFLDYRSRTSKSWILRAELNGRRPTLGVGSYPEISLEKARTIAAEWKELMKQGIDPREEKKKRKAQRFAESIQRQAFRAVADSCWAKKKKEFKNAKHAAQWLQTLQDHAFPVLGDMYPEDIEAAHVLRVLEPLWDTRTDTATKLRGRIEAVISYAYTLRKIQKLNPARWKDNLDQLLPSGRKLIRKKKKHHARVPWQRMPVFWTKLRARKGMASRMLELAILTSSRDGEVRGAKWDEFDLEAKRWTVPAGRMKGDLPHAVPLCDAAIELLKALPRMNDCPYVFWGRNPMRNNDISMLSNGALGKVIDDLHEADVKAGGTGFKDPEVDKIATPHGTARSSFKDWARNRCTHYADEVSELCLAHVNSDETRAAYARDQLMELRLQLMEEYALYLNTPATPGSVIPFTGKAAVDAQAAA